MGTRKGNQKFPEKMGGGNSTVESHSSKVMVAGSNPVPRSKLPGGRLKGGEGSLAPAVL